VPVTGDDEFGFGDSAQARRAIIVGIGEEGGRDRGGVHDDDEVQVTLHEL